MSPLRLRYQTIEFGDTDIHLRTLRDVQQFSDADDVALDLGISSATWPLFGVVWDSSRVLADLMHDYDIEGKRILEVGCGIALSSLVLNKRLANITATDYHPEVESFLEENVRINADRPIPFVRSDWKDECSALGHFDLIIGSDLLYEDEHAHLLSGFIDQHARTTCEVIIVDPGRKLGAKFSKQMIALDFMHSQDRTEGPAGLSKPFKGQVMYYRRGQNSQVDDQARALA